MVITSLSVARKQEGQVRIFRQRWICRLPVAGFSVFTTSVSPCVLRNMHHICYWIRLAVHQLVLSQHVVYFAICPSVSELISLMFMKGKSLIFSLFNNPLYFGQQKFVAAYLKNTLIHLRIVINKVIWTYFSSKFIQSFFLYFEVQSVQRCRKFAHTCALKNHEKL